MKNTFRAALLGLLLFSCRKQDTAVQSTYHYVAVVQASLRDSLSAEDYALLDFASSVVSSVDSLHARILCVPLTGNPRLLIFS